MANARDVVAIGRALPSSSKLASMVRSLASDEALVVHPAATRILARVLIAGVPASVPEMDLGIFAVCEEAFLQHRLLRLEYVDRRGKVSRRRAEPHGLLLRRSGWLLVTLDHARDGAAPRTFRLDRIHAASLTMVRFEPRDPRTLASPLDASESAK